MALIWISVIVVYNSDSGGPFNVGLSQPNATAGSFSAAAAGAPTNYPRGWKMRHVIGFAGGTTRHTLPIASSANAIFQNGGSFTMSYLIGSLAFAVQGRIGERRTTKK